MTDRGALRFLFVVGQFKVNRLRGSTFGPRSTRNEFAGVDFPKSCAVRVGTEVGWRILVKMRCLRSGKEK